MRSGKAVRLAVDIGGTFTDVVLEAGTERTISKVLTTSSQPEVGFLEGIHLVLRKAGIAAGEVDLIVHGTTLATNALIERKGARVGLLCTKGFRDTFEMAYEHRFEQSDVFMLGFLRIRSFARCATNRILKNPRSKKIQCDPDL